MQKDGKLIIANYRDFETEPEGLQLEVLVRRYRSDGSPDTTFGDEGVVTLSFANGPVDQITVQPDGNILLGLYGAWPCAPKDPICLVNPVLDQYADEYFSYGIVQLLSDGTPDNSFGNTGFMTDDAIGIADALTVQPGGKILVLTSSGSDHPRWFSWSVSRFNADGSQDTGFNLDSSVASPFRRSTTAGMSRLAWVDAASPRRSCR